MCLWSISRSVLKAVSSDKKKNETNDRMPETWVNSQTQLVVTFLFIKKSADDRSESKKNSENCRSSKNRWNLRFVKDSHSKCANTNCDV